VHDNVWLKYLIWYERDSQALPKSNEWFLIGVGVTGMHCLFWLQLKIWGSFIVVWCLMLVQDCWSPAVCRHISLDLFVLESTICFIVHQILDLVCFDAVFLYSLKPRNFFVQQWCCSRVHYLTYFRERNVCNMANDVFLLLKPSLNF